MDLSLDDIIRQKKIGGVKKKSNMKVPTGKPPLRRIANKSIGRVVDARQKIIEKKRAKIRDARDKLVELKRKSVVDAREKISSKKKSRFTESYSNGHISGPSLRSRTPGVPFRSAMKQNTLAKRVADVRAPRGYVDYDNMERLEEEEFAAAARLSRTVKNDLTYNSFDNRRRDHSTSALDTWNSDPFNVYDITRTRQDIIMAPELPPPPPKGILRNSSKRSGSPDIYRRRYIPEPSSHLSYEMRSRLENAPDPHASMGIFANPLKPLPTTVQHVSSTGYRIVVSNLHTSVSQADIQELFEDIGPLYDSRIVRPGVAEVIYKSLVDAEKAVEIYHNRQLDGLPMKCLLVNPRASDKPTAPAMRTSSASRLNSGKTPLEIDIDALHKVLFRRH